MYVCPIILGWLLETGVGWELDRGWTEEFGEESRDREFRVYAIELK